MPLTGFATEEGTERFKKRHEAFFAPGHFRQAQGLWQSSIGLGSYLGQPDDENDRLYSEAFKKAYASGINVFDTAVNYRCQRSERAFGAALRAMQQTETFRRDEIFIASKGGFLPFDGSVPEDPSAYFAEQYEESGILEPEEIAQGCHSLSPSFLEIQLQKSLSNLGVTTLDLYYLHNPETQLSDYPREIVAHRLNQAFEWLEQKVIEGKIRAYGLATWQGFRIPSDIPEHLPLEDILALARKAGGESHHLRYVQLPLNIAMPEAWISATQRCEAGEVPFLGLAARHSLTVMTSAPLLQARLLGRLDGLLQGKFGGIETPAQFALQFARSVPPVVTALAGMKTLSHLEENLQTAKTALWNEAELFRLFSEK